MSDLKRALAAMALLAAGCSAVKADVVISSAPTSNMSCANGTCAPLRKNAVLNVTDLTNMLATGNVTIVTYFEIHHPKSAGNIDIEAPLSWTSASQLTLEPGYDLHIDAPLTVMGPGGLIIEAYNYIASAQGSISFWDMSSVFYFAGGYFTLVGDLPTLSADIAAAQGKGSYALANDYDAAGDVFHHAPIPLFSGTFLGLGHSIANLTMKVGSAGCQGLISHNSGQIERLQLHAVKIVSTKNKNVGGVAGCNDGTIELASVDGVVSAPSGSNAGGIVGQNTGSIYGSGTDVSVSGGQAGGIAGENGSEISEVRAEGSVTGQNNTGGVVGANKDELFNCYSTASVNGNGGPAGGVAGFNSQTLTDCYSTGTVSATGFLGGFVGYDPNESVVDGYWDLDTSGIGNPNQGSGFPANDPSPTGLTSAQLTAHLPPGFSSYIWARDPNINGGFPYLIGVPLQ